MKKFLFSVLIFTLFQLSCEYNAPLLTEATAEIDSTPPEVTYFSPAGSTGIQNVRIVISMSEKLNEATVNTDTFIVTENGSPVPGVISFSNLYIRYDIDSSHSGGFLKRNTEYQVNLTTGIRDLYGNALEEDYTNSFQTLAGPRVTLISTDGGLKVDIPVDSDILVSFNEPVDQGGGWSVTVDGSTYDSSDTALLSWNTSFTRLRINPASDFTPGATITVSATGFVSDIDSAVQIDDPANETLTVVSP